MNIYDFAVEVVSDICDIVEGECFIITPMSPGRYGKDQVDTSRLEITVTGIFRRTILTFEGGRQSLATSRVTQTNNTLGPDFNSKYVGSTLFASVDARQFEVDGVISLLPKKPDRLQRKDHPEDQLYAINVVEDDGGRRFILHLVEVSE